MDGDRQDRSAPGAPREPVTPPVRGWGDRLSGSRWGAALVRGTEAFWCIPAALCLLAVVFAEAAVTAEERWGESWYGPLGPALLRVGASGSRDVLGAIASSTLGVAATTFSITMAVLSLTTSSYGPRLVRNVMADRANQLVLGTFVATFLYALLVLRSIRVVGDGETPFVPHLSVGLAVVLAVVCVGMLVFFIHHISETSQVASLAQRVREDLRRAGERAYPTAAGSPLRELDTPAALPAGATADARGPAQELLAEDCGYVVTIDEEGLMALARRADVVVHLGPRPGDYLVATSVLARVQPPGRCDEAVVRSLRRLVTTGRSRTPHQDVEFVVQQLCELLARALSPGTNDPFTAMNALDDLSGGLVAVVGRAAPDPRRVDEDGVLRLVLPRTPPEVLCELVFDTLRAYATTQPLVVLKALDVTERLRPPATPAVRTCLDLHVGLLVEAFAAAGPQEHDLARVRRRAAEVVPA